MLKKFSGKGSQCKKEVEINEDDDDSKPEKEGTEKPKPKIAIAGSLKSADEKIKIDKKEPDEIPLPKITRCKDERSGKLYRPGDQWYGDDDCMHCTCLEDGSMACASPMCGLPFCAKGPAKKVKGRCCPVCPDDVLCSENGRTKIAKRDRWQRDDCSVCQCTKDGVVCVGVSKQNQSCDRPQLWNAKCKPVCLNDISK